MCKCCKYRHIFSVLAVFFAFFFSPITQARPYIEEVQGLEINWSHMTIRFEGSATPQGAKESLLKVENRAAGQALFLAHRNIINYLNVPKYGDYSLAFKVREEVASFVTRNSYIVKTHIYEDHRVTVVMQSSLPYLFRSLGSFARKGGDGLSREAQGLKIGLHIQLDSPSPAVPKYQVVDEEGVKLFDLSMVGSQQFERGLMGSWFVAPTRQELRRQIGANYQSIFAKRDSQGRFVVKRADWQGLINKNGFLVQLGPIAISTP